MLDWSQMFPSSWQRLPGEGERASWLFKGTRVALSAPCSKTSKAARPRIDDFLEWFPGVTRQQVEQVLQHSKSAALATA